MVSFDARYKESLSDRLKSRIVDVPDFPKPGVIFKDVAPILLDSDLFASAVKYMASIVPPTTTKLAAIDARGFLIGPSVAVELKLPLAICRKPGKLPRETYNVSYELEYGTNELCVTKDTISSDDKVYVVDDLLATGGTAKACEELMHKAGASVSGFGFLVELRFLKGRELLNHPTISAIAEY